MAMVVLIICLGLYSRTIRGGITNIVDLKDIIWAAMIYFIFRIVFIDWPFLKVAVAGILFSILIETSQLYHADWIDRIRDSFLGKMILGSNFVWSDLVAYTVGILSALLIDYLLVKYYTKPKRKSIKNHNL